MTKRFSATLSVFSLSVMSLSALAYAQDSKLPDQAELGRNDSHDPCLASRYWDDPALKDPFAVAYSMTCRGATASRHLAIARKVRAIDAPAFQASLQCGQASEFDVPQLGRISSRLCFDRSLGLETVESTMKQGKRGKYVLSVSAVRTAQGPAEELLRMLAGYSIDYTDRGRTVTPAVDVSRLASAPDVAAAVVGNINSEASLEQGLRFVHAGLYLEASRVLNDALSRLPADAPVKTRIELLLASGLADSNLRFFSSASDYFKRADDLLAANPGLPDGAVLANKRSIYGALDLLNRRSFGDAIGALNLIETKGVDAGEPLLDPVTVRTLNHSNSSKRAGIEGLVVAPDVGALSQLVIDAQAAWARSVALLAQNKPAESALALAQADRIFAVLLDEKVNQRQIRWLAARLDRQRARLALRNGDQAGAIAALDQAVANLRAASAEGLSGPTLAETELERAGAIARGGGDPEALLANFEVAINSLIASDSQGALMPPAIEQYLDLLIVDFKAHPDGSSAERFFRALQAAGDPAIARQFVALQTVVASDPNLASKVQDQADLERELTRLRFEIDATPSPDAKTLEQLNDKRRKLELRLDALRTELQSNKAYAAVNDAPATVAELRQSLRPGEAYFKLSKVRNYVFGIVVDGAGATIYRVPNPDIEIEPVAEAVRASIDGGGAKLPHYNVGAAYALFKLLTGPAAERILSAKALVVDANGPLLKLPIGVLVADKESVESYTATRTAAPYDYTKVNFLARAVSISTALSPRSLIVSRKAAASRAPLPFIGFAQHMPVSASSEIPGRMVSIGSGCLVEQKTIAELTRLLTPISANELDRAGQALGINQPRELTGAAFTDTAVKGMTDLDQFQVLHFATHGLTEGQWGRCAKAPPGLVTSLDAPGSDALLSFDEIAKLRLDANLVVLSACETASGISGGLARATGQEEAGATLEGLVRAFLAANARAVMSTYWPISNAGESEDLITEFYKAARVGTIGEALRTAQVKIMTNPMSSHPFYWGAFFVVGDAQQPLLTGKAQMAVQTSLGSEASVSLSRRR